MQEVPVKSSPTPDFPGFRPPSLPATILRMVDCTCYFLTLYVSLAVVSLPAA
ncbi:hypothetical protein K437DRAFT_257623 [Tilletiaria anomala UBC 951]|uniref:Uncharacterized protein n=1 Tax=Tilletiaria anomala (strain ATCC 24038 / CBS 436.72 / UBC 951) TaxID=1037660 RepID=A0A066VWA7_TILAU|nr:uncharacterized protein K437DRAFT_257623 [Tilletiaria anomala UBC 951]KDN43099.1 hypothetical protein K437DRAFT_257623 [Tilletiaria anomala UBC 951]